MMTGDHYKTLFEPGREMGNAEGAHAAFLRDGAEQSRREVMQMGDAWQGGWDEALQRAEQNFVVDNDQADIHENVYGALHRAVDEGENALHRVRGLLS
jgi:hypothetical protein